MARSGSKRPIPRNRLPFAPHATLERARQMADDWRAQLTVLHRAGHINVAAGFGPWREGRHWIDVLARSAAESASRTGRDFVGAA